MGGSAMAIDGETANSGALVAAPRYTLTASLKWDQWKRHTPLLYDMLINNNLTHPSPCVHWGHRVSDDAERSTQRIYYSERGASPNAVVVATAKLPKQRLSSPSTIEKFDEHHSSSQITILCKIKTPEGAEVNKIYTCKQNHNILVTKSDLSQLHVWDLSGGIAGSSFSTMGASSDAVSALRPTAVLQGHADEVCESNFSLDTSPASGRARVLSGDREGMILMWDIEANTPRTGAGGLGAQQVSAVSEFRGHQATVEDVCFHPKSDVEFCSVGDDKRLLFWDERASKDPTLSMPQWSQCDLHCLDWNETDVNLLVTGTADGETFVFDRRRLQRDKGSGAALHKLHEHKDAVLRVGWLPGSTTHFASGGDDASIYVWDLSRVGKILSDAEAETGPAEIIFKHSGHRGSVQDLHWNPVDPWCMASVSEDGEWAKTNTMQIWRPLDLLYKNDEDCINSLAGLQDNFRHSFD